MKKEKFFTILQSKFKIPIQDDTIIPNTPKLWNVFRDLNIECDETIGQRTAKNLYEIYREQKFG